jgi:hypothetical protein
MNPTERNELIDALIEGDISEANFLRLEAEMSVDPAARKAYFDRVALSQALMEEARALPRKQPTVVTTHPSVWRQWRLLTAAAAGLLIGLFSASMVFGFVVQRGVEKRTPLAVFEPGFENPQMPLANGFPAGPARWSGDVARVVAAENGVSPKEGKFMLRLEPMSKGAPRVYQVLDLQSVPSGAGGDLREIEISASFATSVAESSVRHMIRVFAVTEAPENLDSAWFDRRDESIASTTRGLDVMPGTKGWQTFSVRIQVPRAARSLVLFFGARTPDKAARKSPHYLDDVRVSLITPPPLP